MSPKRNGNCCCCPNANVPDALLPICAKCSMVYLTKTGSQWRMLPHTFGCWQTVYGYFNRWREQGIFEQVQQALTRRERKRQGRKLPHQQAALTAKVSRQQHKENQKVMMLEKRSMDANATSLSIPSDSSSAPMSRLLISKTVMAAGAQSVF